MWDETEQEINDILQELIMYDEVPCLTFLARQHGCRLIVRDEEDSFNDD